MPSPVDNLIHVAKVYVTSGQWQHLFLRKSSARFVWYIVETEGEERETEVAADSAEEALRLAAREWRLQNFSPLKCGMRFTLPERDEIGTNALFHQMATSYATMNGVYMDEELGHQCVVHDASQEALDLWRALRFTT